MRTVNRHLGIATEPRTFTVVLKPWLSIRYTLLCIIVHTYNDTTWQYRSIHRKQYGVPLIVVPDTDIVRISLMEGERVQEYRVAAYKL
jgi:hypothetical protein